MSRRTPGSWSGRERGASSRQPGPRYTLSGSCVFDGRCKATWKWKFQLPWREAGPPNHHDDKSECGPADCQWKSLPQDPARSVVCCVIIVNTRAAPCVIQSVGSPLSTVHLARHKRPGISQLGLPNHARNTIKDERVCEAKNRGKGVGPTIWIIRLRTDSGCRRIT